MGICCGAQAVSDAVIDQLLANPPLIWRLLAPDDAETYWQATGQRQKPGLLAKLFRAKSGAELPTLPPALSLPDPPVPDMDLDKAWDGINFCLKKIVGDKVPNFFEGGTPVGKIEMGYGPALAWHSRDVAAFANALALVTAEDILALYDPAAMKKVYLGDAWARNTDDMKEYLTENFLSLKNFLQACAARNLGCLISFS